MANVKKVKVSQVAAFLNTAASTATTATYSRMGKGITDIAISYSPTETSETYIDEDNATTSIDGYKISLDQEQTAYAGEPIFDFVDGLRNTLAIGSDCETQILLVDIYSGTDSSYRAQVYNVTISVSEFGGKGGESAKIKYKVNLNGNPTNGTATITNGVATFTATGA